MRSVTYSLTCYIACMVAGLWTNRSGPAVYNADPPAETTLLSKCCKRARAELHLMHSAEPAGYGSVRKI